MTHNNSAEPSIRRNTILLALASVLLIGAGWLTITVRYEFYPVQTTVMDPAVPRDRTVLVAPLTDGVQPERGDIVVVESGGWSDETAGVEYILRVGAVGGDTVSCCDAQGRVQVNDKVQDIADVSGEAPGAAAFTVTVPAGRLFLLGDRRDAARDSRAHLSLVDGTVPLTAVKGRVVASLLPPGPLGGGHAGLSANPFNLSGTWLYALASIAFGVLGLLLLAVRGYSAVMRRRTHAAVRAA
jgi:signal peptidase I